MMWLRQALVLLAWVAPAMLSAVPTSYRKPKAFDLIFTWEKHAPDGFEKYMILANGQFPGPLLELNYGDDVQVTVHNRMPFNAVQTFLNNELPRQLAL